MGRLNAKNIDDTVLNSFKSMVILKHGKLRDSYGKELEKALVMYMEHNMKPSSDISKDSTHTHVNESAEEISQKKKKDANMSPYYARLTAIQDRMRDVGAWDVESFQDGIAVRFIKELCGGDSRTINKYYSDLQTKWTIEH